MNDFLIRNNDAAEIIEKEIQKRDSIKKYDTRKWDEFSRKFNMFGKSAEEMKDIKAILEKMSFDANIRSIRRLVPLDEKCGKIRFFARRLIRKFVRWYIEPMIVDQNKYNNEVLEVLAGLEKKIDVLERNMDKL